MIKRILKIRIKKLKSLYRLRITFSSPQPDLVQTLSTSLKNITLKTLSTNSADFVLSEDSKSSLKITTRTRPDAHLFSSKFYLEYLGDYPTTKFYVSLVKQTLLDVMRKDTIIDVIDESLDL